MEIALVMSIVTKHSAVVGLVREDFRRLSYLRGDRIIEPFKG